MQQAGNTVTPFLEESLKTAKKNREETVLKNDCSGEGEEPIEQNRLKSDEVNKNTSHESHNDHIPEFTKQDYRLRLTVSRWTSCDTQGT